MGAFFLFIARMGGKYTVPLSLRNFSHQDIIIIMNELYHKLLIIRTPGIGPIKYADLIRRFGDATTAAGAISPNDAVRDGVRREMDRAAALNIHYICDDDVRYPPRLRELKNHPPILTVRGNVDVLRRPMVAMVGTRHASAAGMTFMANMAEQFSSHGITVASGMAMGTDTAAHRGALRSSNDGATVAVLAGGVDYIWPIENESLYDDIMARGAIISEMPVGYVPLATNFIQRNRWVAGIADQLILGEADPKSGSVTTARFAIEMNRPVFAVPGHPSDPRSMGPNGLIRDGVAKICINIDDFFDKKTHQNTKKEKKFDAENVILDAIGTIPVTESVLADIVQKSISEIKRELVVLELQGLVRNTGAGYVRM